MVRFHGCPQFATIKFVTSALSSINKNRKTIFLLVLIFFLALLLRLYNLPLIPVGLHADEINAGYVGRFILLHGKDVYGNPFPLYFDKIGDFRPTGIFYLSGLSTFLLGLNSFAIRFPSALFGALTIIPFFFLGSELFGNKKIGILAAILLAIMPWHIMLSRATSESIIGLFFFVSGIAFYLKFAKSGNKTHFICSMIFFFIPYFFYHTFRFITPFFFLFFVLTSVQKEKRKHALFGLLFFAALLTLLAFSKFGSSRFSQVSFFNSYEMQQLIKDSKASDIGGSGWKTQIYYNKPFMYTREFIHLYASYYTIDYLFSNGGLPERYRVPQAGLMPFLWILFLAVGLLNLIKNPKSKKEFLFVAFLLLITPLPAALTNEDAPNIQRSTLMIIPMVITSAYGAWLLLNSKNKKMALFLSACFIFVGIFELVYFWHQYTVHTRDYKLYTRGEGERELVARLIEDSKSQKTYIVPIFEDLPTVYMYYTKDLSNDAYRVLKKDAKEVRINNVIFVNTRCPSREFYRLNIKEKNIQLFDSLNCDYDPNGQFREAGFITYQTGERAYRILVP